MSLSDVSFRPAWDDEKPRIDRMFPEVARAGQCFVAVRTRPVERILGTVFWRKDDNAVEFRWGSLPALADTAGEAAFLQAFRDMQASAGCAHLRCADPLPEGAQARLLQACGFQPATRQDCCISEVEPWVQRSRKLLARRAPRPGSRLAAVTPADAAPLADLAARHSVLLADQEIQAALVPTAAAARFDPRHSALLFQGERLIGACLVRLFAGQIGIPLLVAEGAAPAATALLFSHCLERLAGEEVSQVRFCFDPETHPTLPRLARRCRHQATLTSWQLALGTTGAGGAEGSASLLHPPLEKGIST